MPAATRRRRRGAGQLSAPPATQRGPAAVRVGARAARPDQRAGRVGHRVSGVQARAAAARQRASPAAYRSDRDAQGRRVAARGRRSAAPPPARDDRHLCQGRPPRTARSGAPVAGSRIMSPLHEALREYLQLRRSLGYQLKPHEHLLKQFIAFLEDAGATRITTDLAVAWARLPHDAKPWWWTARLGVVRGFARHLATIDPAHEVPPKDLLAAREQRLAPYIYSAAEITALMDAAGARQPPIRGATHRTLIGLLATTGLRLGESLALERADLDVDDGVLHVHGKDGKPRELPLHETTTRALAEYAR